MTDAAEKLAHPVVVLNQYLTDRKDSLRSALPPHIKPERFISSVMIAVQLNPDLLACDRRSLWLSCMRCAQDGLMPDGAEAAIVPYKAKATYIAMYQGLIKQFHNSGQFKEINARIAYEGESWEHWIDENGEHFKHVPARGGDADRKIACVYAWATTKDGGFFLADLTMADINKRRAMSRASRDDAPWKQWFEEMAKKTALRVLAKRLPKSSDIDAFLQRDEAESLGVETADAISDHRGQAFGNVMDHFAEFASATDAGGTVTTEEAKGGASQGTATQASMVASEASSTSRDPAAALEFAHRRGQEAKAAGVSRKAVPPEYRDEAHGREGLAWIAGWDGSALPSFGE